jgi:hypothetical protein
MSSEIIKPRDAGLYYLNARSLSDLKNRSEKTAERGQFLTISPGNSRSIAQENGKKWTVPPFLQPISFKSDRLLGSGDLAVIQALALILQPYNPTRATPTTGPGVAACGITIFGGDATTNLGFA